MILMFVKKYIFFSCSPMLHVFNKDIFKTVILWKIILFKKICFLLEFNLFLWRKAEFSASFLQSSVSRDPSEMFLISWFAQETFSFLWSMLKTVMLLDIFVGKNDTFFSESFDEDKSSKEQHLFDQKYCFYCHFWFI